MKKTLLLTVLCMPAVLWAQTILIDENFDSYTVGNYIGNESPYFTTWSDAPGTSEDAFVSDSVFNSLSNSVHVVGDAGPTDLFIPFDSVLTTGVFEVRVKYWVSPDLGAYFNLQETDNAGDGWKLEIYFDSQGNVEILGGTTSGSATYTPGAWTEITVNVDLDADEGKVYINGNLEHTYIFSTGAAGTGTIASWGGINIFAAGGNSQTTEPADFFIDDLIIEDQTAVVGISGGYADASLGLYPNPSGGQFSLQLPGLGEYTLMITDMSGKTVYMESVRSGSEKYSMDVGLPSGMYLMQVENEQLRTVERLVIY